MSVLATTHPTLLDHAKRTDPDGKIARIVELLNLTNPILDDAVWLEGNLPTGHRTTVRTGIPKPTWRRLNYGVVPTKSTTAQVTAATGNLEAYAEVDKDVADLNGNTQEWRLSEDQAHIEGMTQEMASTLIYGNDTIDEAEFTGLAAHYNDLSAENADNIIQNKDIEGNDNTSIYLVVWGPNTVHGIFPKGSSAGLKHEDKGQVTLESAPGGPTGGRMEAYRSHYKWEAGLVVRDWRYVVRIQIDQEDLVKDGSTGPDLVDLLTDAVERIPSLGMGRAVFYANRKVVSYLRRQVKNSVKNSTLTMEQTANNGGTGSVRREVYFDGIPVKRVDAILNTEAAIT